MRPSGSCSSQLQMKDPMSAYLLHKGRSQEPGWMCSHLQLLGLQMDGDTIRVAMGLHLGIPLWLPHDCQHCGTKVESLGTHGLSCGRSQGQHYRHASISALIQRHLSSAGIPAQLEPVGVCRSDDKWPDGASITLWKSSHLLVWDITCPDTYALTHIGLASNEAGLVAAQAEQKKNRKSQSCCLAIILHHCYWHWWSVWTRGHCLPQGPWSMPTFPVWRLTFPLSYCNQRVHNFNSFNYCPAPIWLCKRKESDFKLSKSGDPKRCHVGDRYIHIYSASCKIP